MLLLFLVLQTINCASLPLCSTVTRSDASIDPKTLLVTYKDVKVKNCKPPTESDSSFLSSSIQAPFSLDFTCSANNQELCDKAHRGFESAANRIAQVLVIRTQIVIKAVFRPFCSTMDANTCSNRLGQASPGAVFTARPNNDQDSAWYSYPQSLVKQITPFGMQYSTYDVLAEFNSDYPFWFQGDQLPMTSNMIDFEFVISHEITHGLGFESSWTDWSQKFPGYASSPYLTQKLDTTRQGENIQTSGWKPVNIFDKFHFTTERSEQLLTIAIPILSYAGPSNLHEFIQNFETTSAINQANQLYQIVTTPKSVAFRSSNMEFDTILSTTNKFVPGTSMGHLDYDSYRDTPDFLMVPQVGKLAGSTLDDIISRNTKQGTIAPMHIYGPKTLKILSSIGWPTVDDPRPVQIIINGVDYGGEFRNGNEVPIMGQRNSGVVVVFPILLYVAVALVSLFTI